MKACAWKAMLACILLLAGSAARGAHLDDAMRFFNGGHYEEAHLLFQEVFKSTPDNVQARYTDALCLKELGKFGEFRAAAAKLKGSYRELTPEQRETLDRELVIALFRSRAWIEAKTLAAQFPTSHTQSKSLDRIRIVEVQSSYEYGFKKAWDVRNYGLTDTEDQRTRREKNLAEATSSLRQFVDQKDALERSLAADQSDISTKSQSRLFENVWRARLILGEEEALLKEQENAPADIQEYFQSVRTATHFDFIPEELDKNAALLKQYLIAYPESDWTNTLLIGVLKSCFTQGMILRDNGRGAQGRGQAELGQSYTQRASRYLAFYRATVDTGILDRQPALLPVDQEEIQNNYLVSLSYEGRHEEMIEKGRWIAGRNAKLSKMWAIGKIYQGIGMAGKQPPDLAQAARLLDEVVNENIEDDRRNNLVPVMAIRWRASVAQRMNDKEALDRVIKRLKFDIPDCPARTEALKQFSNLAQ